jgi:HKD family nuclease
MLISNITNTHKSALNKLLKKCEGNLIIVSPFLASQMQTFLDGFDFSGVAKLELITTFKRKDPEQLTKPFQLRDFSDYFKTKYPKIKTVIHVNNDLHGKLYISLGKKKQMILTSGNFTKNGMVENHEWGLLIDDQSIIEEALEEVFDNIDYKEISANQIDRACKFAEANIKENPQWCKKPVIVSDILETIYSDNDQNNIEPQYFLKPIGHKERPVTLEGQQDFSELHQNLHFSKKRPKGVRKGDLVITTAVGAGSLLSCFRVTGDVQHVTEEKVAQEPWLERWPWYLEGRNRSPEFGKEWWIHNLRRQDLLVEFRGLYPDVPVTYAGGFSLGTLNMGNDKVRITKEFGEFLISKILEHEHSEKEPLKINLNPADPDEFKAKLLKYKRAIITRYYNDGRIEETLWNASRFTIDSGVYNNIRSKTGLRQGEWQELGIDYIDVSVQE